MLFRSQKYSPLGGIVFDRFQTCIDSPTINIRHVKTAHTKQSRSLSRIYFYYTYINENIYMVDCSLSKQRNVNVYNQLQYSYTKEIPVYHLLPFLFSFLFRSLFATFSRLKVENRRNFVSRGTCRPTRVDH